MCVWGGGGGGERGLDGRTYVRMAVILYAPPFKMAGS